MAQRGELTSTSRIASLLPLLSLNVDKIPLGKNCGKPRLCELPVILPDARANIVSRW